MSASEALESDSDHTNLPSRLSKHKDGQVKIEGSYPSTSEASPLSTEDYGYPSSHRSSSVRQIDTNTSTGDDIPPLLPTITVANTSVDSIGWHLSYTVESSWIEDEVMETNYPSRELLDLVSSYPVEYFIRNDNNDSS